MHGTRIRWLQILVVLIVLTLHNNHMGKIAAQEPETVLPSFYISDEATIWLVDFEGRRQIEMFTLSDQRQVNVDSLPTSEHFMLAGFDKPVTHVSRYIRGLTSVNKNRLLIQVDNERCNHMVTGSRACAGYSELLLLNPDKSVRHLTTIEYHYAPALDSMTCWRGNNVQLSEIIVNPSKDLAVIRLVKLHFQCDRSNTWGIFLDFSGNEVVREDIPFGYGFSWSPDGKSLAYVDLAECIVLLTQQELLDCGGTLKLRTETETVSLPPLTVNPGDIAHHIDHLTWVNSSTLAYRQSTTPFKGMDSVSTEFVWRNVETEEANVQTYESLYHLHSTLTTIYSAGVDRLGDIIHMSTEFIPDADSILYAAPVIE